jgi:nucleoside-diphosphate-sugar epimerase
VTRLLITGATGFLGRHCLTALKASGAGELHCTSRISRHNTNDGVTWHAVDLRDPDAISVLIETLRPSHVLHAAWEATPVSYADSPDNLLWLSAGRAMLEAFGRSGGKRFVGLGTSAEYAPSLAPCVEGVTPICPVNAYGEAKAAMALSVADASTRHGFSAAWGRVFLPYGPGDPLQRLLPSVRSALLSDQIVPLTDGLQQRDFVYAPDVGRQLVKLFQSDAKGPFNIATGVPSTVREAVETMASMLGKNHLLRFGVRPRRPGDADVLVADMAHFQSEVGLPPVTSLVDGLTAFLSTDFHTDSVG